MVIILISTLQSALDLLLPEGAGSSPPKKHTPLHGTADIKVHNRLNHWQLSCQHFVAPFKDGKQNRSAVHRSPIGTRIHSDYAYVLKRASLMAAARIPDPGQRKVIRASTRNRLQGA